MQCRNVQRLSDEGDTVHPRVAALQEELLALQEAERLWRAGESGPPVSPGLQYSYRRLF